MTNKIKKILATLMLVFSFSITLNAQIFIVDDDEYNSRYTEDFNVDNPNWHGSGEDWFEEYVPVGSGTLLLAGLAGAYLLGKKKKK